MHVALTCVDASLWALSRPRPFSFSHVLECAFQPRATALPVHAILDTLHAQTWLCGCAPHSSPSQQSGEICQDVARKKGSARPDKARKEGGEACKAKNGLKNGFRKECLIRFRREIHKPPRGVLCEGCLQWLEKRFLTKVSFGLTYTRTRAKPQRAWVPRWSARRTVSKKVSLHQASVRQVSRWLRR